VISNPFNFPSVDHLVEGRDYRIVDWSFADGAPVEKQKPEETVQPNQQNAPAPAQAPQPAAQTAPPAQAPTAAPAAQAPPQTGPCKEGEKSVFGVCRKVGGNNPQDEKDFDSSKKSDEEKAAEAEAKKQGSDVKNNKPVMVNGKKMGWAVKNGKPVMVEWGAVAGQKQVGPKQPQVKGASGGPKPLTGAATPKPKQPAAAPKVDTAAKIAELQQAMKVPGLPPAAQKALQNAIDLMGA
jgi:hypothetical protein